VPITEHRCGRSSKMPSAALTRATGVCLEPFSRTEKGMSSVRFLLRRIGSCDTFQSYLQGQFARHR